MHRHQFTIIAYLLLLATGLFVFSGCAREMDVLERDKGVPSIGGNVDRGPTFIDPTVGMEFVAIQGGCFMMGDSFGDGEPDEKPVHEVCLDGFTMARYPVTVGQFRKFVAATGYRTVKNPRIWSLHDLALLSRERG